MPRLPHLAPLYDIFATFLQNCWVEDRSLLWPERAVWTIPSLEAMRRRFVEGFIEGNLTFREKFESQLSGVQPEVWALAADCFYVYGMISRSMRFETKHSLIVWTANRAGWSIPPESDPIWEPFKIGMAQTGQKYNLKHAQLRLLTLAALEVKALDDRAAALHSSDQMRGILDGLLESIPVKLDRANDMRNAILHLAFPDEFEPILTNRDKDAILHYYGRQVKGQLSLDRDEALRQVRSALAPRFAEVDPSSEHPFDFFGELRGEWRPAAELERALVREVAGTGVSSRAGREALETSQDAITSRAAREQPEGYHAVLPEDPDLRRVLAALRRTSNVILSGPPGVGKTYLAQQAALHLVGQQADSLNHPYVRWITFHPSYAYEDFVEGLRPVLVSEGSNPVGQSQGRLAYEVRPGVFKSFCEQAARDPDQRYVLVIDEINRGNLARILGELVTLLEDDKRGKLHLTLPYSGQMFTVPPNLVILGTMNSTDRSIALLDVALRRRFAFVEIAPRPDLLAGATVETDEAVVHLDTLLRSLNASITRLLDRDHQIGHSYLINVARAQPEERLEALAFVWNLQILPLLEEYFYARRERLEELLPSFLDESQDWQEGALLARLSGEDLVVALSRLEG